MRYKKYFCTFSDSTLQPTLKRISKEANSSGFFDESFIFNEFNLDKEFKERFKHVLKYNSKGFGYWVWKVSIIKNVLAQMENDDILLYADAGCNINKDGAIKFNEYVKLVNETELGILAVELEKGMTESKYTKGDLFDYFNVRDNDLIYNTSQIQAGLILIRKNPAAVKLFDDWQKVFESNFSLINDEQSKTENFPDFIEHRHDQSIFSILFKLNKGVKIPLSDVWITDVKEIHKLKNSPVWCLRKKNRKTKGIKFVFINFLSNCLGLSR